MKRYVLCIDNGLTTTKSVIFTLQGKEVASSVKKTVVTSRDKIAEIDMELQWKNTAEAIRECLAKSGISPEDIAGIGNSGHGAGLYCLDGENKPVRKAVSSMDARTIGILEDWSREGKSSYGRLHQNLWSGQPVPILYWLKKEEPEYYKRIEKILMVKDWIIFRLTGETGMEYTDASNSGLINPVSRQADREIFEMFDIGEAFGKIPAIRQSTQVAGYISSAAAGETGLKEGTPVIGGVFDVAACALGSGVCSDDRYSIIAGTWNVNTGIENKLVCGGGTIKCSLFADIEKYLYVESSATSAVNLDWFVENIMKRCMGDSMPNSRLYMMIDDAVGRIKPEETGMIYMPFLYKSDLSRNLDGSFLGMKPEHGLSNMLRAIFEGVAFAHLKHINVLRNSGLERNRAVLSGGASNSEAWCQVFADVLDMEVSVTETSQVGALGTAICIAVATGKYGGFQEAIDAMVKVKRRYEPDLRNKDIYSEKYREFSKIIDLFEKIQ